MQAALAGSFTARGRGLLANEFEIMKDGSEAGRLNFDGQHGAKFCAGTLEASIEKSPNKGYEMFSGKDRELTATLSTSSLETPAIACGESVYPAHVSFLRNEAAVFSPAGGELVRLSGNISGRRYEAVADETDAAALPVAILLLYFTAVFRRRVYVGGLSSGAPRTRRGRFKLWSTYSGQRSIDGAGPELR